MQRGAEIAQRPEYLGAGHEHDQQRLDAHQTVARAVDAEREHRGGADADAEIDDAARDQARRQHLHGGGAQAVGFLGQHAAVGGALAERFERREPLHRVEELGAEGFERIALRHVHGAVEPADRRGQHQARERHREHERRERQVPPGDDGKQREGRERGDRKLRHVLAEERLQLLDAVDEGKHHAAGALAREPGGAEFRDLVVELEAQHFLHARGGAVREHGARVLEHAAQDHRGGGRRGRQHQRGGGRAVKDAREHCAQEHEPRHADRGGGEAHEDGRDDAPAHAARELPHPPIEKHGCLSRKGE